MYLKIRGPTEFDMNNRENDIKVFKDFTVVV